jgi:hypothetical protein
VAKTEGGYETVKHAVRKLWNALPTIHHYWGFSGGIDKEGVFYDVLTKKLTILNWDRGQLPLFHLRGYSHGETSWETKDRFMCVYNTYGKRIINGFSDARSAGNLNVVDKEALLNCLLECRVLSRFASEKRIQKVDGNPTPGEDVMR